MKNMKTKLLAPLIATGMLLAWSVSAADDEKTITGEGKCAKCALKETAKCQNAIVADENGKQVTYYLTENAVSKDFHDNICKKSAKVKATGTVKDVNGKMELTATKIDMVKE